MANEGEAITSAQRELKDGIAEYHLILIYPGLWHMYGSGQPHVFPFFRQKDALAEAERLAKSLGAKGMVAHFQNTGKWAPQPTVNPATNRLHMASEY